MNNSRKSYVVKNDKDAGERMPLTRRTKEYALCSARTTFD